MNKKGKNHSRKKKLLFKKKQILAIIFVSIFFLVGSTTFKVLDTLRPVAMGVSTEEVFSTMILNNPVKLGLIKEIERMEREQAKADIEAIREAERKKKEAERIELEKERKNKKIAYLTFDDGPSVEVTPRILDTLKEYNIKATFFVLGKAANVNEKVLKRIHEEGHAIGHHSYSHNYNHIYRNTGNFIEELGKTNKVFKRVLGQEFETKLLRFPGGSFEKSKQKFKKSTAALGYKSYDWNALNGDAEGHNLPKSRLVNRLKETALARKDKKELIILMHDTDAKPTTADALPEIIDYLIKEGYEFDTLNEN